MNLITSCREMQEAAADAQRNRRRIALVPTMGSLHAGHVALIRKAHERGAAVAVSVYVNPSQFGPREDFTTYPRDLSADCRLCEREGVEVVFAPTDDDMYAGGAAAFTGGKAQAQPTTWVEETTLAKRLEGERRPGHFRGVCTVVAKLFNIVHPDVAVFGEKDFQQLKVIERMVRDLNYPVEIIPVPTVRETDGLALSSRNQYLKPEERAQATVVWKALNVARDLFKGGERNPHRIESAMLRTVELAPACRLDYAEIADAQTLEPVREVKRGDVALIAAFVGKTRLIDNLIM